MLLLAVRIWQRILSISAKGKVKDGVRYFSLAALFISVQIKTISVKKQHRAWTWSPFRILLFNVQTTQMTKHVHVRGQREREGDLDQDQESARGNKMKRSGSKRRTSNTEENQPSEEGTVQLQVSCLDLSFLCSWLLQFKLSLLYHARFWVKKAKTKHFSPNLCTALKCRALNLKRPIQKCNNTNYQINRVISLFWLPSQLYRHGLWLVVIPIPAGCWYFTLSLFCVWPHLHNRNQWKFWISAKGRKFNFQLKLAGVNMATL